MASVKNKRGSALDLIALVIFGIILIVVILAFYFMYSAIDTGLEDVKNGMSGQELQQFNQSAALVQDRASEFPVFWDFLFVLLFFGFWFSIIAGAYLLGNNPVFLILYFMMGFVMLISWFTIQYALQTFIENTTIASYMINFPMISFVINHFGIIGIVMYAAVGVALYAKPSDGGGF